MANGPAPFSEVGKRARGKPVLEIIYSFSYVFAPRCFLYAVEHIYGHQLLLYPPQQHPDTFFRVQIGSVIGIWNN